MSVRLICGTQYSREVSLSYKHNKNMAQSCRSFTVLNIMQASYSPGFSVRPDRSICCFHVSATGIATLGSFPEQSRPGQMHFALCTNLALLLRFRLLFTCLFSFRLGQSHPSLLSSVKMLFVQRCQGHYFFSTGRQCS